jgi:hypothetical protein
MLARAGASIDRGRWIGHSCTGNQGRKDDPSTSRRSCVTARVSRTAASRGSEDSAGWHQGGRCSGDDGGWLVREGHDLKLRDAGAVHLRIRARRSNASLANFSNARVIFGIPASSDGIMLATGGDAAPRKGKTWPARHRSGLMRSASGQS